MVHTYGNSDTCDFEYNFGRNRIEYSSNLVRFIGILYLEFYVSCQSRNSCFFFVSHFLAGGVCQLSVFNEC
jgi:hypothetical protein